MCVSQNEIVLTLWQQGEMKDKLLDLDNTNDILNTTHNIMIITSYVLMKCIRHTNFRFQGTSCVNGLSEMALLWFQVSILMLKCKYVDKDNPYLEKSII